MHVELLVQRHALVLTMPRALLDRNILLFIAVARTATSVDKPHLY